MCAFCTVERVKVDIFVKQLIYQQYILPIHKIYYALLIRDLPNIL